MVRSTTTCHYAPLRASTRHYAPLRNYAPLRASNPMLLNDHYAPPLRASFVKLMLLNDHYAPLRATTKCHYAPLILRHYMRCFTHFSLWNYRTSNIHHCKSLFTSGCTTSNHYAPVLLTPQSLILRHILRCFTHFSCMKVSELQISIIASPCLPLVAPSNHILSGW